MVLPSYEGSIASAAAAQAYVATAIRLAGGPPLAYWRLASTDSVLDEMGTRNGSWTISGGSLVSGLPQGSDGAVNFKGAARAEVPHDAGLALPAFTLSFWFMQHSLPDVEQPGTSDPLFSKESSAGAAINGDTTIFVHEDGSLNIRLQSGGASHFISMPDLELNVPHHLVLRADNSGFDAYLDGIYLGKNTNVTEAWSNNTHALQLAASPPFANLGDCTLDEVALYDRVLTEDEVLQLAQRAAGAPVAVSDSASVPESSTTTIHVLENDSFVGTPTIEIVSQPAGGDSVAVNGSAVDYTAGAVAADTARSFQYRITDPNGTSASASVSVIVLNADTPVVSNANCYQIPGASSVVVNTMNDLQTQVNAAPAGRHILIANGTYTGGTLNLAPAGTGANPIVIRPQNGRGDVTINNANWTIATGSARLVVANLFFNNPKLTVNGQHHRITRCRFRQLDATNVRIMAATDTRIDHCDFSDMVDSDLGGRRMILTEPASIANGSLRRLLMDYNYIHDTNITIESSNNYAYFFSGASNTIWNVNPGIIIDHCLYRNCLDVNHGEFVVVKCSGAIVRFCTFENVSGYLQQRTGGGWEVRSCWFENMGNSAPLKCFDMFEAGTLSGAGRQLVIGNRLVNHDIWVGAGNESGDDIGGLAVPNPYHRSREGRFIGNICRNIFVGEVWGTEVVPALNNNLHDNTASRVNVLQSGTTTNVDNEPYVPAVKIPTPTLAAGDAVGMFAPDPLCPAGPQS